jgi:hypothetical protein
LKASGDHFHLSKSWGSHFRTRRRQLPVSAVSFGVTHTDRNDPDEYAGVLTIRGFDIPAAARSVRPVDASKSNRDTRQCS